MDNNSIIKLLLQNSFTWNRVNSQPCVHTFYGKYYVNLCHWMPNGINTISIDVDDIEEGVNDLVSLDIKEGDENFDDIISIYNCAIENAQNIAA